MVINDCSAIVFIPFFRLLLTNKHDRPSASSTSSSPTNPLPRGQCESFRVCKQMRVLIGSHLKRQLAAAAEPVSGWKRGRADERVTQRLQGPSPQPDFDPEPHGSAEKCHHQTRSTDSLLIKTCPSFRFPPFSARAPSSSQMSFSGGRRSSPCN